MFKELVNWQGNTEWNPLIWAVDNGLIYSNCIKNHLFSGHLDCVKEILTMPETDINTANPDGKAALVLAVEKGNQLIIVNMLT